MRNANASTAPSLFIHQSSTSTHLIASNSTSTIAHHPFTPDFSPPARLSHHASSRAHLSSLAHCCVLAFCCPTSFASSAPVYPSNMPTIIGHLESRQRASRTICCHSLARVLYISFLPLRIIKYLYFDSILTRHSYYILKAKLYSCAVFLGGHGRAPGLKEKAGRLGPGWGLGLQTDYINLVLLHFPVIPTFRFWSRLVLFAQARKGWRTRKPRVPT